MVNFMAPSV
jgi:hypothetical protein